MISCEIYQPTAETKSQNTQKILVEKFLGSNWFEYLGRGGSIIWLPVKEKQTHCKSVWHGLEGTFKLSHSHVVFLMWPLYFMNIVSLYWCYCCCFNAFASIESSHISPLSHEELFFAGFRDKNKTPRVLNHDIHWPHLLKRQMDYYSPNIPE